MRTISRRNSLAFQLKGNKLRTREGACACVQKARRRKGRGSAKTRKACGTSKNDRNEGGGGGGGGGLKRISAAIATVADFQTMQRASRAIAFRSGFVEKDRDIEARERRGENTKENKRILSTLESGFLISI
ncbi:hypothetical protein ACS0PU_005485 [Formica fusca]